jgi:hypothetical protein
MPLLWLSGAGTALSRAAGQSSWLILCGYALLMLLAGAVYGRIFMRAANDSAGGWLFGISFGFLLWMLGPVTLLQSFRHDPLLVVSASRALFAAHLLYGLGLGLLFPTIHRFLHRRW